MRWSKFLFGLSLSLLALVFLGSSEAAEQRCDELGDNCVCSEPLNTNSYTQNGASWNPADSTTKQCSMEAANHPVARNSTVSGTNNSTVIGALPAGHRINYVLWGGDNNTGIFWIGNDAANSSDCGAGWQRCEFRWYQYKSSNFQPTNSGYGGTCSGDKHAEVKYEGGPDSVINPASQVSGDGMGIYNFLSNGWTPNLDCCGTGPLLANDTTITGASQRGKWWRFSHVIRNPAGGSGTNKFHLEIYAKNVTDGGNEVKILDLEGSGSPNWNGPYNTVTPPGRARTILVNAYREGTCAGFEAYSHFMVAHWNTDAGQRIGPAYEIEGGQSTVTAPPASPSALTVR